MTERKLAAIMIADVVGFSRLMGRDESGVFQRVRQLREEVTQPLVEADGGRIIKTTGDGFLAEFPSGSAAIRSGVSIQKTVAEREATQTEEDRLRLRIGINLGDIIIDGDDVAGDGVNIAARLEPLSPPDGLCISLSVRDQLRDDLGVIVEDIGEQKLKNIERPVRAFTVVLAGQTTLDGFSVARPVRGFGGRPAIAVLPFDNMSNDPDQEYFADGIAEDILTRLAMWRWMPVIGRNSSFAYRGKSVDLKRVGTELGARYILEGSVRKSGNRVRITGQLIDTETGHHVWAQKYDRVLDDIFALQDEITEAIVAALEPAVGHAERTRVMQKGTQNLDAWELYQRGVWCFSKLTKESLQEAYKLCLEAAERDPQFAEPLGFAARIKGYEVHSGWADPAAYREAHRLAVAARDRDPVDPYPLAVLATLCGVLGMYDSALQAAMTSVELNPSNPPGRYSLGYVNFVLGKPEVSVAEIETALRLSPNDINIPMWSSTLAGAYGLLGNHEKSLELSKFIVERVPTYLPSYRNQAIALGNLGRIEEGRNTLNKLLEGDPSFCISRIRLSVNFKFDSDFEQFVAGLRKLGCNE